jgi:plasmid stabilization system protein ParE
MSLPLVFRTAAQMEFDDAADWYDSEQAGLGAAFVAEVQEVLDTIAAHPERYPIATGDVREAAVSRFPYYIYYRVKTNHIAVIAVFHTSRDRAVWQARK